VGLGSELHRGRDTRRDWYRRRYANARAHIGSGPNPHWHQPTDIYANFNDKDFLLGLNAAQTTLGAVAELAGARVKE